MWKWVLWFFAALVAALLILGERAPAAQPMVKVPVACADEMSVLRRFHNRYQEAPVAAADVVGAFRASKQKIMILANDRGMWTLLLWKVPGELCPLMAGNNWRTLQGRKAEL